MKLHVIPLSEERLYLIVQIGSEVMVELIPLSELTQRVLNYASIPSFSIAYTE